jgi:CHASE3 domain sensor protein
MLLSGLSKRGGKWMTIAAKILLGLTLAFGFLALAMYFMCHWRLNKISQIYTDDMISARDALTKAERQVRESLTYAKALEESAIEADGYFPEVDSDEN